MQEESEIKYQLEVVRGKTALITGGTTGIGRATAILVQVRPHLQEI